MSRGNDDGGLEGLFGFTDEPAAGEPFAEERPRSRAVWLIRNALLVAVATLVTVAALRVAGTRVNILIIVAAFVALRLLMLAVAEVAPPPMARPARRLAEEEGSRGAGTDSLRAAVRRWEQRLEWSQSDVARFSRNVLPVLAELTDERLRLRHGITRSSDPRRARELIGEPLWRVLDDPGLRPPKRQDLASYVEVLERL